ncbi:hypothetical protein B0T11DRAFT_142841 [Plectosphaerella cucumerina]|uniref:Uncharacterized protein n=1 Tax=Plectosphaerella cucumerina TaxID=40658 RepID=A0A8K0T4M1_9PEZI|nr:hypothetical protein B0T11DRAFT_142841 [Plectosphaerella cucumerina]
MVEVFVTLLSMTPDCLLAVCSFDGPSMKPEYHLSTPIQASLAEFYSSPVVVGILECTASTYCHSYGRLKSTAAGMAPSVHPEQGRRPERR